MYCFVLFGLNNDCPDQIYPADSLTATSATAAVKLKIDERGRLLEVLDSTKLPCIEKILAYLLEICKIIFL